MEDESGRRSPDGATPTIRWCSTDRRYASDFRAVVSSPPLEALARVADAQAVKLDEREAPERENARQKKAADDARASQEKARLVNKAAFRP